MTSDQRGRHPFAVHRGLSWAANSVSVASPRSAFAVTSTMPAISSRSAWLIKSAAEM